MRFPRASGVLLHPTSLPSPHGSGDFGPGAYHFVDWLVAAGQSWWQVLPVHIPDELGSPYASRSAFAGHEGLLAEPSLARGVVQPFALEQQGRPMELKP